MNKPGRCGRGWFGLRFRARRGVGDGGRPIETICKTALRVSYSLSVEVICREFPAVLYFCSISHFLPSGIPREEEASWTTLKRWPVYPESINTMINVHLSRE